MAHFKFAFVGLCVFLCLSLSYANINGASSRSINGGGDGDRDDDIRIPKMSSANINGASSRSINGGGDEDADDDGRFPKMSFANTNRASSKSINSGGDNDPRSPKMMPSGTGEHPLSGSAHLRGTGFGFGFGFDCSLPGACQNPNRPVTVEYPCPGYGSICNPSPCYPNQPSYGCQPCNQPQTNIAQKVNIKNGAQDSPQAATETMPRAPNKH